MLLKYYIKMVISTRKALSFILGNILIQVTTEQVKN